MHGRGHTSGGCYLKPMGITYVDTGKKRLDIVADYIRKQRRVSPLYDGRRVVR